MSSLDLIKQILVSEMELEPNRVWAYNANQDLPKDSNLFIVLHYGERKPISNTIRYKAQDEGLYEIQSINVAEDVIVSLISKDTSARDRAHEPHLAFNSTYSRQVQEKNKIHISILGDVYDASFLESTSRMNRFDCKVRVFRGYDKIKAVDYYDKFPIDGVFQPEFKIEP